MKGMGEKQIEVDRRLLKTRITQLRRELESVRDHRQQYRDRRASTPIPVISLVGSHFTRVALRILVTHGVAAFLEISDNDIGFANGSELSRVFLD